MQDMPSPLQEDLPAPTLVSVRNSWIHWYPEESIPPILFLPYIPGYTSCPVWHTHSSLTDADHLPAYIPENLKIPRKFPSVQTCGFPTYSENFCDSPPDKSGTAYHKIPN